MTARVRETVLSACLLATLTACPAPGTRSSEPTTAASSVASSAASSAAAPLPAVGTDASIGLPAYPGPPSGGPRSTGPVTRVRAAVDLTSVAAGLAPQVRFAVATPGGGAYVVLSPDGGGHPQQLGTVRLTPAGYRVTHTVPLPMADVWGLHLLADGRVVATGPIDPLDATVQDYGFAVVDPATGGVRTTRLVPFGPPRDLAVGRSTVGGDGRTLFLFLSLSAGPSPREQLLSADTTTGALLYDRDLSNDVESTSQAPAAHDVAGLVPRPDGGVTLVLDATPQATRAGRIPTLLRYDRRLAPDGDPVRVTSLAERAQTRAVAAGRDGTVFLAVSVPDGAWILAVTDHGGAGPVLAQLPGSLVGPALVVEPAQVWALVAGATGARALDLTTGRVRPPIDLGCAGQHLRAMVPGSGGVGALVAGECTSGSTRSPMLWILGP